MRRAECGVDLLSIVIKPDTASPAFSIGFEVAGLKHNQILWR